MVRVLATNRKVAVNRINAVTRVLRGAPGQPIGVVATPGNGSVTIAVTADLGAANYNLYRGTVSGGELTIALATFSGTTYIDNAVSNGTTYFYIVRAVAAGGQISLPSLEASATPTGAAPSGNYVAEDGVTNYVAEDGVTQYVTET